ncbi:hypothetical protein BIY21_15465 [Vibrio ponticus]|uniref:DUF4156 domain-containing protein n=1 Tax=Vibrio ponticus TaxID=265668 RepID=A0ABX3FBY4_9VIBR|nr:DUF4156 domain-containing protein [Vibrio ponticus]OLQ89207.1 hypothetical protein BIY21_15465 [Vibrio ponticus]
MLLKPRSIFSTLALITLAGCASPHTQLNQGAQDVHVRLDSGFNADKCQWLGEVTGTEGHWYSYLFFTNDAMVQGAMNDIKNRAKKLGATTVYMIAPQDFTTSFTVVGNAYNCG